MADPTKAWHAVFDKGTKQAQERLKKAHGKKPEFQAFLKSRGIESGERSVKQATTSLKKTTDAKVAAQKIADMRYKKALQVSSDRVREMGRRRRESGEGLGGGLETARDVVAHVKKYGSIKAGRLGEAMDRTQLIGKVAKDAEKKKAAMKIVDRLRSASYGRGAGLNPSKDMKLNPSSPLKTDMSALSHKRHSMNYEEVQIDEVSKKEAEAMLGGPVKEKPKMPPGKQPAGYRYVRNLARKAMNKGAVAAVHKSMEKTMQKEEAEITEASKDDREYGYEGDMAMSQLKSIIANAQKLHDMLEPSTDLPEWVQSKITLAEDYVVTAANYCATELDEEALAALNAELAEEVELFEKAPPGSKYERMVKHIKKGYAKGGLTPQEKSIAYATAWKAYKKNEEVEQVEEKYMGFAAVKKAVAAKGARNPAAVAAAIGRKKYGKEKFQAMAAAGKRKANEETEVVVEAEGKVAVTPKEKALAAHHGDPKRITYGDVIKARLKAAAAKKMGK